MKALAPVLSLALFLSSAVGLSAAPKPLNVVFILADDYGWRDLGCYGSTFYETPNLDHLAAEGVRFTQAYAACPVCSPTRASIMTGKYPARLHLTDWLPGYGDVPWHKLKRPDFLQHLPLEEVTLAEAAKAAGYATGIVGKWHLGGEGFFPEDQGFDVNAGGCELGHPPSYFSPYKIPKLPDGPKGEYLTDRLTDEAVKFIEEKKDGPFFLYLAEYAVHNPQQAKPETIEKYRKKAATLPPLDGPEFVPEGTSKARQVQNQPIYAAMIESMDESVGRVLKKLAELGLEENTVVIFTSDNGGLSTSEGSPTSNLPLRAGKGWLYEGGIREPLLVKWPGVTKAGTVCDQPVISTDYYPTILEMAGLPARPTQHMDGKSFVPLLRGVADGAGDRPFFWHYPHYSNQGDTPCGAVRSGDLKLIEHYEDMRVELYNLHDDLGEKHDLAAAMPEKANRLRDLLHHWREDVGAQMTRVNGNYDPNAPRPTPKAKPQKAAEVREWSRILAFAEQDD